MTTESFDMTASLVPKSDQINAEDMLTGPRTVEIEKVTAGTAEQPVNVHLVGYPGRPFKPSKTVRRILVAAWGPEASKYIGRRMTLYRDPTVRFGGQDVGGIRVSHLSHIDKPLTISLTETRGKRKTHRIEPLPDGPPALTAEQSDEIEARIQSAATIAELDAVAAHLKNFTLGPHAERLKQAGRERKTTLTEKGDQ